MLLGFEFSSTNEMGYKSSVTKIKALIIAAHDLFHYKQMKHHRPHVESLLWMSEVSSLTFIS